jgi:hypothetical protein
VLVDERVGGQSAKQQPARGEQGQQPLGKPPPPPRPGRGCRRGRWGVGGLKPQAELAGLISDLGGVEAAVVGDGDDPGGAQHHDGADPGQAAECALEVAGAVQAALGDPEAAVRRHRGCAWGGRAGGRLAHRATPAPAAVAVAASSVRHQPSSNSWGTQGSSMR